MASPVPPIDADDPECVALAANVAVMRALEVAGKRLLTRDRRSQYQHLPAWKLHTEIPAREEDLDRLLADAWTCLQQVLPHRGDLVAVVDEYVRDLLRSGLPHETRWLMRALTTGDEQRERH
ncbi:hypothetical protein AB0F88_17335 [Streptosporangium sp. NPDC023963]|uniref:hypothetical protein n=1 Tax=unclassified Streptosporangium TaxID=2632669 RepID=UPI003444FA37